MDIQGTTVTGLQIHEIGVIIKNAPEEFLATVRPLTVLKRNLRPPDNTKIIYSAIVPMPTAPLVPMPTAIPSGGEVCVCMVGGGGGEEFVHMMRLLINIKEGFGIPKGVE